MDSGHAPTTRSTIHHVLRRAATTGVAILAVLLFVSPSLAAETAAVGPRLSGTVIGVIDGDTVDVRLPSGRIRVRLHGIDAPERDQPRGQASRRELSKLVHRREVAIEPVEQDQYDRLVGRLWRDEMDVNAELVRRGAAWVYRRYATEGAWCRYEKTARDAGRGLWSLPPAERVAPWEWRQREHRRRPFTDYSQQTVAQCVKSFGR
jgi:endonuclease YncB( thermonuclease family)